MNCPHCDRDLTILEAARSRCPHCGQRFDRRALGVVRTGTIRVAAGDTDQVYRSFEELSPPLREQLQQALQNPEVETILIADEHGREQIFQIIKGLPPEAQKKVLGALRLAAPAASPLAKRLYKRRVWLLAGAATGLAVLLYWIWR